MDWPWRNTAPMTKIDSAPVFKPQQPQTAHSHFVASTSTSAYPPPPPSYLITAPKHTMNRLVSFFSSPPDKRINNNSHLTNSSSSEMIASTNRPRTSRNDNNNQTRIGRSGDRTAITPHSSRANYHPTYNSSQSDASDSEDEDIQHASAPKQRHSDQRDQRYDHYNQYEDDDIAQQQSQIDSFIQSGVCAVYLNAIGGEPGAQFAISLSKAGIPVFADPLS